MARGVLAKVSLLTDLIWGNIKELFYETSSNIYIYIYDGILFWRTMSVSISVPPYEYQIHQCS